MSVIIKGMDMPNRCESCGFINPYRLPPVCGLTGTRILGEANARLDNCPFVEIPPHGRLIDADALIRKVPDVVAYDEDGDESNEGYTEDMILKEPTIIEAEEA